MKNAPRLVALVFVVALAAPLAAIPSGPHLAAARQETPQELPRFRAGANLVRVDAYVAASDGTPVSDLAAEDFEVLEDGVPQRVESFEVIRPRGPAPEALRIEPNTVAESRAFAAEADARVFVLFLDLWHVQIGGSFRAQSPIINLLNRVIGQDDLVGLMTPEMSARNMALGRRTRALETMLQDNWHWGERGRLNSSDPREEEIRMCYPDSGSTTGFAERVIERRRVRRTLDAIQDLIVHLEGIREERKFVMLLSEGWLLPRRDDNLAVMLQGRMAGDDPISVGPGGRLTTRDPRRPDDNVQGCDRERLRLAAEDFESDFRTLLQRANRANVSFYTIDPRGLVAFDEDISVRRAASPAADGARLRARQDALRELAENTDGIAVVNTNNIEGALSRMVADVSSYYLLGYYSTNTRLDGRFRKLTVRVKRPGLQVRARPGYLAPTEAEAASARVTALMNGAPPGHSDTPPELRRALERLAPARGNLPARMQAVGGGGRIWLTTEIDTATLKTDEWEAGGRARVVLEHERGATAPVETELALEPGQQSFTIHQPEGGRLPPGRYVIRLWLLAAGGSVPVQLTSDVVVPPADASLASSPMVSRRGPSTGLQYHATADARFRRTERLRLEIPRFGDGIAAARLLGRDGLPLPIPVTVSERAGDAGETLVVADLTLAPLAQGEYVLEVSLDRDGKKTLVAYGFRLVP